MAEATSHGNTFDHLNSPAFRARLSSGRTSDRAFLTICVLLFAASAALTILCCISMSAMGGMPMPGGWRMSMAWMRMPGQTWLDVAASFLRMWVVMMIAMMLPSVAPALWRYRQVLRWIPRKHLDYLTTLIAAAYFLVWTGLGIAVFAVGATLANLEMHRPPFASLVPSLASVVVLVAGVLQFTPWKTRELACCRELSRPDRSAAVDPYGAWREGLHLGVRCSLCCVGLTAVLLVGGIMNLGVMAVVTAGITLERLAPTSMRVAEVIGAIMIVAGLILIARTVAAA
jgi:predicted metal-binding membrane protein